MSASFFAGSYTVHERPKAAQISSTGSFEMKYIPVVVSFVEFVITVFPNFNAPFSTTPPPGLGFRWSALAPFRTVKFAKLISFGLRLTIVGRPKKLAVTASWLIWSSK